MKKSSTEWLSALPVSTYLVEWLAQYLIRIRGFGLINVLFTVSGIRQDLNIWLCLVILVWNWPREVGCPLR